MGLFSKIKDNLNHGGVKIDFQAPATASMKDPTIPVNITITGGSSQQTVNSISAEIIATSQNQSFSQPNTDINSNNTTTTIKTVARSDNTEQFILLPNETKTIQLNIVMNAGAAVAGQAPQDGATAQIAGIMQKLQTASEVFNSDSWRYEIQVKADVEGIKLDPSKSHHLQLLKPGQIGTTIAGVDLNLGM